MVQACSSVHCRLLNQQVVHSHMREEYCRHMRHPMLVVARTRHLAIAADGKGIKELSSVGIAGSEDAMDHDEL